MIINKEYLKDVELLTIGLENCDEYEIEAKDIVNIYIKCRKRKYKYKAIDGYIVISKNALKKLSSFMIDIIEEENLNNIDENYLLGKRLLNCCDTCFLTIEKENGENYYIYLPYEPLCEYLHGNEIELSNCPSAEIQDDGNLIILLGKYSRAPKRIDNNYKELILGWENIFKDKDYIPKILKCELQNVSNFRTPKGSYRLSVDLLIRSKNNKKHSLKLIFEDYDNLEFDINAEVFKNCKLKMSRMANRKIFVALDGCGIQFECARIKEYKHYCNNRD